MSEPYITPPCVCGHTRTIHEADDAHRWCLYPKCPCRKYVPRS
jgi:hypothetical protein